MGDAVTWRDIFACVLCVVAFAPVLLAPGYCLAWTQNLFGFRQRSLGERLAWGTVFSFGVMPIATVELSKYGSLSAVCWLTGFCGAVFLGLVVSDAWKQPPSLAGNSVLIGSGVAVTWILIVVMALVDVGVGNRLFLSVTVFDHALRTEFVDSVLRTGVPPANPLYWPGHAAPMRYYYFWYALAAAAARLGEGTARQAMIASVAWAGFGLAAVLTLYCRHFLGGNPLGGNPMHPNARRWPRIALALALLAVTGLDVLPALLKAIFRLPTNADMEWWSGDQVTSWIDSLIWAPHHVAGLICCLFGFLLVWLSKDLSAKQRCQCVVFAGLSFASAFGLSTWVPVAFALVMLAWMVWTLVWEIDSRPRVPVLLGAGLVAVLALSPYLQELRSSPVTATMVGGTAAGAATDSVVSGASHLLGIHFRRIIGAEKLLAIPWFASRFHLHPVVARLIIVFAALLVFPLVGYFVELGFYGLILVVAWRAMRRSQLDQAVRTSLFLASVVLFVATFVGSKVITSNDFGWRSVLIAQFFLLLLAVQWFEGALGATRKPLRTAMFVMVWIGLAGSVYQVIGQRLYLPVEEALGRQEETGLAERAMAWRRAFNAMDGRIPRDAVVQYDTTQPSDYFRYAQMLQVGRQTATAFPECDIFFGGEMSACAGVEQSVARLFATDVAAHGPIPGGSLSIADAKAECGKLGVSYLVATRWDSVWFDSQDWVWKLPAVVDTGEVRVLDCTMPAK